MIGDVRHKSESDLKTVEERTLLLIDKYFQKLRFTSGMGEGDDLIKTLGAPSGINNMELEKKLEQLKDEMKHTVDRQISSNSDKLTEARK